ncbi:hypothetical protein G6F70_002149 [Rhizopus microsporus]|nr:hypothetical protein G6F71_000695 [Rhizopus microsporus]KAG1202586.1 hypothetical protein G6F70_002149 [Rhizopus microsporus]KAG1213262.1 hypothetical protein G6F69_002957 [Rhizopus microsporus]KAG1235224.1 hypothetical protein G6F67_002909 [Rhizopus microsporus]KAG1267331.1 hypothetical protein G6F68_002037 [Rhizopus microsporus]
MKRKKDNDPPPPKAKRNKGKESTIATKKISLIKSEALRYLSATLLLTEPVNKSEYDYMFVFTNDHYTYLKRHLAQLMLLPTRWNDGLVALINEDQQFVKEKELNTSKVIYCGN